MVQAGVTLGAVGQAFQPDKKRVRLESLTYGRATRNRTVLNHAETNGLSAAQSREGQGHRETRFVSRSRETKRPWAHPARPRNAWLGRGGAVPWGRATGVLPGGPCSGSWPRNATPGSVRPVAGILTVRRERSASAGSALAERSPINIFRAPRKRPRLSAPMMEKGAATVRPH